MQYDTAKESTDGKIAVVKADINNMGKIFSEINDYGNYSKLSRLLVDKISIKFFKISIDHYKKSNLKGKILPLYIEGMMCFMQFKLMHFCRRLIC